MVLGVGSEKRVTGANNFRFQKLEIWKRAADLTISLDEIADQLTEFLLPKGYEVSGMIRRTSSFSTRRIDHLYQDPHEIKPKLRLVYGDPADASSINRHLKMIRPDEIYNLGAQSTNHQANANRNKEQSTKHKAPRTREA